MTKILKTRDCTQLRFNFLFLSPKKRKGGQVLFHHFPLFLFFFFFLSLIFIMTIRQNGTKTIKKRKRTEKSLVAKFLSFEKSNGLQGSSNIGTCSLFRSLCNICRINGNDVGKRVVSVGMELVYSAVTNALQNNTFV